MAGRFTPKKVEELSMCEVFVFGSNLAGEHYGGAACMAHERFGAEWGVGVGSTGQCYAIPTMHGGIEDIKPYVDDFIKYVKAHPNHRFLVTRIGCGIAGFKDKQMAPLFKALRDTPNVCLPREWMLILMNDDVIDAYLTGVTPEEPTVEIPEAITEKDLIRLCDEYRYVIGARILGAPKPDIMIRYVVERGKFGYARFGDFFMDEHEDFYVWTRNKKYADDHDQAMTEATFGDECRGRGYFIPAIFAGVKTPYKDVNGESIYTGDVIDMQLKEGGEYTFALGTLGENAEGREARYAFVLDNHCILPEMCKTMKRVGTVFYQIGFNEYYQSIPDLCYRFQPWHGDDVSKEDKLLMARYTPNFDQEMWKYHACQILELEFNWRN